MISNFRIYLIGVGGQGIGLLSEVIARACDYAGYNISGVDTHGLAQRGGTVESHLKIGNNIYSPLLRKNTADLVIALERTEALRALNNYSKYNSTLIYYNASWQPLFVRLKRDKAISEEDIYNLAIKKNVLVHKIFLEELEDSRMQNIVLISNISKLNLIPNVEKDHYESALRDLLKNQLLNNNLSLFSKLNN